MLLRPPIPSMSMPGCGCRYGPGPQHVLAGPLALARVVLSTGSIHPTEHVLHLWHELHDIPHLHQWKYVVHILTFAWIPQDVHLLPVHTRTVISNILIWILNTSSLFICTVTAEKPACSNVTFSHYNEPTPVSLNCKLTWQKHKINANKLLKDSANA